MSKDLDIYDTKMYVFKRDGYRCQHSGCNVRGVDNLQAAHRISKGVENAKRNANRDYVMRFWFEQYKELITKKEAMAILNHPLNLVSSCEKHNSYFNCGNRVVDRIRILRDIKRAIDG